MQSKVNILLCVQGIYQSFKEHIYLDGINLDILSSEILFICGYSGSGKTSLIEILCKYQKPEYGKIFLKEQDITNTTIYDANFKYLPKEPVVFENQNVRENIYIGFRDDCAADDKRKKDVFLKTLNLLGISHISEKSMDEISYCEKYLICFARTMVQNSPIVFIDEPFNNLDNKTKKRLVYAIEQYHKLNVSFVITSNSLEDAKALDARIIVIENSKTRDEGKYETILDEPKSKYVAESSSQMYFMQSKILESDENNIIIGDSRNSSITIPRSSIKNFNIYGLSERTVTFFINYKNIYYKIDHESEQDNKNKKYTIENMKFVCKNVKQLPNGNLVRLQLCGNDKFILNLVINDTVQNGQFFSVGFKSIDLFIVEKNNK